VPLLDGLQGRRCLGPPLEVYVAGGEVEIGPDRAEVRPDRFLIEKSCVEPLAEAQQAIRKVADPEDMAGFERQDILVDAFRRFKLSIHRLQISSRTEDIHVLPSELATLTPLDDAVVDAMLKEPPLPNDRVREVGIGGGVNRRVEVRRIMARLEQAELLQETRRIGCFAPIEPDVQPMAVGLLIGQDRNFLVGRFIKSRIEGVVECNGNQLTQPMLGEMVQTMGSVVQTEPRIEASVIRYVEDAQELRGSQADAGKQGSSGLVDIGFFAPHGGKGHAAV
jgi:hypothetical protein